MRVKQKDESGVDLGHPKFDRHYIRSCILESSTEPFACEWIFGIFDDPDDLEEIDHTEIEESWETVGECIRAVMFSYSDSGQLSALLGKDV